MRKHLLVLAVLCFIASGFVFVGVAKAGTGVGVAEVGTDATLQAVPEVVALIPVLCQDQQCVKGPEKGGGWVYACQPLEGFWCSVKQQGASCEEGFCDGESAPVGVSKLSP